MPFDVLLDCHGPLDIRFTNVQPQNSELSQIVKKTKSFVQDGSKSSVSIQYHLPLVDSSLCQFVLSQQSLKFKYSLQLFYSAALVLRPGSDDHSSLDVHCLISSTYIFSRSVLLHQIAYRAVLSGIFLLPQSNKSS